MKSDEERLRKLINFVKPLQLPEYKPPSPSQQMSEEVVKNEETVKIEEAKVKIINPTEKSTGSDKLPSEPAKKKTDRPTNSNEFVSPAMLKQQLKIAAKPSQSKKAETVRKNLFYL